MEKNPLGELSHKARDIENQFINKHLPSGLSGFNCNLCNKPVAMGGVKDLHGKYSVRGSSFCRPCAKRIGLVDASSSDRVKTAHSHTNLLRLFVHREDPQGALGDFLDSCSEGEHCIIEECNGDISTLMKLIQKVDHDVCGTVKDLEMDQ